jgi:SAM-dependent methyltransferase
MTDLLYHSLRDRLLRGETRELIQTAGSVRKEGVVDYALELEQEKEGHPVLEFYFRALTGLLGKVGDGPDSPKRILDVGCAIGDLSARMARAYPKWNFTSVDLMEAAIRMAKAKHSVANLQFHCGDFLSSSFPPADVVTCLQTLEHIPDGSLDLFLSGLFAKAERAVLVSVPREPFWCLANLARGKYWHRLGNTPHHVQHWTKRGFSRWVESHARKRWKDFRLAVRSPLSLWTLVLVENRPPR